MTQEQYERIRDFIAYEPDTGTVEGLIKAIGGKEIVLTNLHEGSLFCRAYRIVQNCLDQQKELDEIIIREEGTLKTLMDRYKRLVDGGLNGKILEKIMTDIYEGLN